MANPSTRLEKLFKLLETGTTDEVRATAATQIGLVQKHHPQELQILLQRLLPFLFSKQWETRTAAEKAIESIASYVPQWRTEINPSAPEPTDTGRIFLSFDALDLSQVLAQGEPLLASGGSEFDVDWSSVDAQKRVGIQRRLLMKRLGIHNRIGIKTEMWVNDQDFISKAKERQAKATQEASNVMQSMEHKVMSARERNRAKRLIKQTQKQPQTMSTASDTTVPSLAPQESTEWPFTAFCDRLLHDLFDRQWEIRHGAASGLRAIMRHHGKGFGVPQQAHSTSQCECILEQWTNDCAVRLLLIFALDRFMDFFFGTAVAPVRETAAQVLGALLKHAPVNSVTGTVRKLLQLGQQTSWEHRHSCFVGLKVVLGVRKDLLSHVWEDVVTGVMNGLKDASDDVRAVAADVLYAILPKVTAEMPQSIENILTVLWDVLDELDDLSASTDSVMKVLSTFYSAGGVSERELAVRMGRLWKFMRHPIVSVRQNVLMVVLGIFNGCLSSDWFSTVFSDAFVLVFQNILLETDSHTLKLSFDCWTSLTRRGVDLIPLQSENVSFFVSLLKTPLSHPIDAQLKYYESFGFLLDSKKKRKSQAVSLIALENSLEVLLKGAKALALILPSNLCSMLQSLLQSQSASHRSVALMTLSEYCKSHTLPFPLSYIPQLTQWSELSPLSSRLIEQNALLPHAKDPQIITESIKSTESAFTTLKSALDLQISVLTAQVAVYAKTYDKIDPVVKPLLKQLKKGYPTLHSDVSHAFATFLYDIRAKTLPVAKIIQKILAVATSQYSSTAGELVLSQICAIFASNLFENVPFLLAELGITQSASEPTLLAYQFDLTALFSRHLDVSLLPQLFKTLPQLFNALSNDFLTEKACSTILALSLRDSTTVYSAIVATVVPQLELSVDIRRGASHLIRQLLQSHSVLILPFLAFFVTPLLKRMSDPDTLTREHCSLAFSTAISLLPLEAETDDSHLPHHILALKQTHRQFIHRILNRSQCAHRKLRNPPNVTLRPYQQEGVDWLSFLYEFNLNGILCDDMGLGKTLQCLCLIMQELNTVNLIICPSTLTHHWKYEIDKFWDSFSTKVLIYEGNPTQRRSIPLESAHIVIVSYKTIRQDIDRFTAVKWNFCVLDEGHLIKNPKAKVSLAIRSLPTRKRLILSGTPIQNNVLELWSLFDFLMPGYLGTHRHFHETFAKPIAASNSTKPTARVQEEGIKALERLHRQVLPFLMRRMKEDVLKDLPPKIIQDRLCSLSALQLKLYESLGKPKSTEPQHIFKTLQYLLKLCSHPKLVLSPQQQRGLDLDDISNAPKLVALKQLFEETQLLSLDTIKPHRMLIFAQLKSMLDIVQSDLLQKHCPQITFLRLDGSVPPSQRFEIVQQFNSDPSVDVLLLTTSVGGLGLNLTGADTVVFLEHDWNPSKDLQAMDRAHRLGQKKVVNVFRIVTRDSIEEKIMSLQKFKLGVANAVVTQENASLDTMDTEKVLELFSVASEQVQEEQVEDGVDAMGQVIGKKAKKGSLQDVLQGLGDLWDESQYEQYDATTFIESLGQ